MQSVFLTAEWNNLVMASYIVDPAILLPYLPAKTTLDLHNNNAYVSLVGFMFENTRLFGLKIPFHVNFEEVNLRFYVRYKDNGTWKRGTVFIKEIVPRRAISMVANTIYREKYATMRMKHFRDELPSEIKLSYQWMYLGNWNTLSATTDKKALPMIPGSEEEFIAEHYWGYSKYNGNITFEYRVQHPAWKVFRVKEYKIDCDFTALYGRGFSALQTIPPHSVFVAKGSPISIGVKRNL